jgi:hypothetical protein
MKVGDMVMLIHVDIDSSGYRKGVRIGDIGTVIDVHPVVRSVYYVEVIIDLQGMRCGCLYRQLVVIPGNAKHIEDERTRVSDIVS